MPIRTFPALAPILTVALAAPALAQPCDPVWSPLNAGTNEEVLALAPFQGSLYVGGAFTGAGEKDALRIARWDGSEWFEVGGGISGGSPRVNAILGFGEGDKAALYAAGYFTLAGGVEAHHIAKWDGAHWSAVGGGLGEPAYCLASWNDGHGPAVYVGGNFISAGGVEAHHVARWDGEHWTALGAGLDAQVLALAVYNDGTGETLYAGGEFLHSGDHAVSHIAKWNGQAWTGVGDGTDEAVYALFATHNFGDHPTLFAGGEFTHAGGVEASHIARWNGEHWSALGGGVAGVDKPIVTGITEFNDSDGLAIYATGYFSTAGDKSVHHIARWNGDSWTNVGDGLGEPGYALAVYEGGPGIGAGLFAGGDFHKAGNVDANFIARWGCVQGPPPPCYADLNKDGVLDLFDFLFFVNLFNKGSFDADCDHNGVLDLFDFLCYTNAFNAGC